MSTAPAARSLAAARRDAGLSQEELAARSHVSERTIRAMESGRAKRPHRDTLVAVGRALGLAGRALDGFVAEWRAGRRAVDDLVDAPSPSAAIHDEIARQRERVRERSVELTVRATAERRWSALTVRRRFEVLSGELDRFTWMTSFDRNAVDADTFTVTDCVNIEPRAEIDLPESGARAFVGMLRQTLHPGDVYAFEYTFDYAASYLPGAAHTAEDDDIRLALPASLDRLGFEVRFAQDAVPVRAHAVRQHTVGSEVDLVTELTVSAFGVLQYQLEPAPSGVHGVYWDWD